MLSKIMFLREERDLLMEEKIENDQLGKKIAANLESMAKFRRPFFAKNILF